MLGSVAVSTSRHGPDAQPMTRITSLAAVAALLLLCSNASLAHHHTEAAVVAEPPPAATVVVEPTSADALMAAADKPASATLPGTGNLVSSTVATEAAPASGPALPLLLGLLASTGLLLGLILKARRRRQMPQNPAAV